MPQLTEEQKVKLDSNIKNMLANGATNEQVVAYANDFKNKFSTVLKPTGETADGIPTVTIQEKSTPTQAPAWQDVFEGVVGIKEAKKQELPQIPFETTSTPDPYSSYTLTTRGKQVFGEGAKQTKKEVISQSQDKGDPYLAVYKNQIRKIGIDPDQEYTPSAFIQLKKQENLSNVNQLKSDIESGNSISGKQNPTQEDEMTAISERVSEELSPIKQEKLNLFNKITENNNFIKSLQAQKTPSEEVITEEELKSIDDTINKVKKENEILSKKYQDLDTDSKLITSYFEKPTLKRGITYQTFQNNPEELLKLDETKVLYGALEDYLNSSNIGDNTLRRAKLLNATTLRDGTKLFDVLTKPTWTKNEYEEIYSLLNIKPEELQKEASQSIDAITNLMKEDIYKQGEQLSVYKNLPKNYLNDKIQSGEITEEEAKQFIQEYTSQVDNFNKKIASLNRVEEIQNKYFKDLKRFQAFKEYQDEISKKFNFNQDIVGALREGTVDNVIDAVDFANKEKATIEAKLGVITPEQELAKYLQIGTSRDYDYMRYTPDYIKNMQFLEVNPETEEKSINWRALGHSAIKTTAESYMLYLTGLGISKAAQLQRLSKYGKVGEFVSEHAGIIPASELYIQPDMFDEVLQKYENGEISLSQLRSLSEMQAGIEGVTELWFMPEAKALKGVLNTGSKELALNVFLKSATGKELVNTFGKAATKAAWEGTKTGLGESWEGVLGNILNDTYNYQVKLDNPDYKYTTQNTLENNLNTVVNTFISMYPTILLGAGQTYASNKSSAATQASLYEVAQNPSEFYKYAKDFIENTNNLEWYFPTLTKKEVLNKVAETNNKLADLYKQALPITSKLDNESDKIDYFNSLNIVNTLTPALRSKKEDELLEEAVQKIQKYTANIAYQDSLKAKDPLKFLAYKVENGLENYEYDSKDPIKLSIIGKSLFNSLQEFQNKPGYEKLVKKIEEKIDLVNKNIELANKIEVSQEQQPLISEPVQKESVNLFEQETQKLDSLSKEDIESYKVPKEITDKEERKQLTLKRLQKLQELEDKENEVLGFQRNQKVQLLSDKNTDKYYTIQGEEDGRLLLKAEFDGVTETTKVSPKDITPFTPKPLKEETVVETAPTSSIEQAFGKQETKGDLSGELQIQLKNRVKSIWNKNSNKFDLFNSKNQPLKNKKQLKKYTSILSETPNVIKTWWNELLKESDKIKVVNYLKDLKSILEKGVLDSPENYITEEIILMDYLKGVKFKPSQIEDYVTDVNLKKWTKTDGVDLDTFVSDYLKTELQENGFDLEDDEIINKIYELISQYPNGISKKEFNKVVSDSNPLKDFYNLQDEFLDTFGLDIETVLYKLSQEQIQEYENKTIPKSEISETLTRAEKETQEIDDFVEEITQKSDIEKLQNKLFNKTISENDWNSETHGDFVKYLGLIGENEQRDTIRNIPPKDSRALYLAHSLRFQKDGNAQAEILLKKADIERRRQEDLETTKNIGEDKLKEGRENTKKLVESLKQRYPATSVQGIIIRILEKLIDFSKYSTIIDSDYLNGRNASGQATWFGMIISQETFDGILAGKEFEVHTFIHEFIHGFTTSKISDYNIEKQGLIPGFKSKLTAKEKNAIEQLQRIFEKVKRDNPKSKEYGFTNLDEFIAEAFSNSSFQYTLKNTKAEGKKSNLFSEFINAVGDLLFEQLERWAKRFNKEIPERSTITGILEDVLAWTEELIDQNNKLAYIATNEEINAKYDAELDALEKPTEEEEDIEQVPLSSAIAAFGEPEITNPVDIIADLENQLKQQQELQDKENTKEVKEKEKQTFGRFHPWATVPYSLNKAPDKVITTAINTYKYLNDLAKESGKPFSELGYYITIFDVRDFDNSLFPSETQEYWKSKDKRGQVAVITNEKGEIIKFSEVGKPDTNGLWAMQWFNASLEMPKFTGENSQIKEEKWIADKKKLDALRANVSINKPITLTIQDIVVSSQYTTSEEKPISLQFTEIPFINIGRPNTITVDGITHNIQSGKTKIGVELATSIYDFLNVNNVQEGLPEAFYPASDSYEDKLKAFHNRLSFSVSQRSTEKTFPEIIFYTQNGIRMFRMESNGEPSLFIRGKTYLTKDEIVKYISENEMNISQYLNSQKDQTKPILTIYSLRDNKFEAKETPYQRFIADNFKIALSKEEKPKFNPYINFGESLLKYKKSKEVVVKQEKVEQEPDLQQPQKPVETKLPPKKERKKKDNALDDVLERHISLPSKGTKSQQSTAKEWFDNYLALTGANYQDLRDTYNSTARATWTKAAITLYKTGVYTDLYHEAFHDFTQLYLTPEQKISLYKEALETKEGKQAIEKEKKRLKKETLSPLEEYHAIEELLAEDFLNYMLSEQKLILNQRPKRNTIFRKIYNFLKSLFGVNPSIQEVYERLASNKPIKSKRDPANALFGKLNSSYDQLSIRDSIALTKALDGLLAQRVINGNYSVSKIFLEKGFIDKVYNSVYNDLLDSYSGLEEQYPSANEEKQAEIQYTLNNLDYVLDNWDEIIKKHKSNSEYLKVSKDLLPDTLDEDGNEVEQNTEKFEDAKENINPMDDVAKHIKFLIASLPKHEWKNGKKVEVRNSFLPIVSDTVNFGDAKNLLAEKLQGDKDYNSVYKKIKELSEKHPEFKQLLKSLPLPDKSLDFYELQLKNSFINAFSKPFRYLKTTNFEYSPQGTKVISRNAQFTTVKKLKDDWTLSIQEFDNPYRITQESGQKSIDIPKIVSDFKQITKNNSEEFLQALGFVFSEPTKQNEEYLDLINLKDNTLRDVLNSLKDYNNLIQGKYPKDIIPTTDVVNKLKSPVYSLVNILDRNLKSQDKTIFYSPRAALDKLVNLELKNSEKYHTDNVSNAENNNQWIPKNWSLQSIDASILNNVEKYPTYVELISSKEGRYWDISLNPDANNLILNSLFDLNPKSLTYKQRRTKSNGKPVTLELFDQNGVIITNETSALRDGTKTSKLTRFMALVADFPVFLSTGEKQHPRYGDKSTSIGSFMEYPSFVKGNVKTNKHLPVDIKDFNTDKISEQAWVIFRNQLISTLQITNDFYADIAYQHASHITKNIQESNFGLFDLILSEDTKTKLASITSEEPINVSDLVDSNKDLILNDLSNFFNEQSKLTQQEFSFNELSPKDFLPSYLLDNYPFEQLVRAFTVNTWIYNAEHIRNQFQDLRFYKKDKRFVEAFKRFSKSTSSGLLSVNDTQNNEFFNNPATGSFAEKKWYDENHTEKSLPYVETGVVNTIILEDVKYSPEKYANDLLERIKKAPQEEIDAIKDKLKDLDSTDAMAFCTWDFYRNLILSQGKEEWNGEKEKLYQKLAKREPLTQEDETNAYLFFPPLKQRVAGRTFDETTNKFIPIDYKFAITPLIPTVVKDKNYEIIRNNMIRQNVGLALFATASKHSAILNSENKFNKLYESKGVPYTGDYTINPVPIEYFFEVVKQPSDYKGEDRFSTQLRTLLFVNLFENGVPVDYKKSKESWDSLTESEKIAASPSYKRAVEFSNAIDNIVKIRRDSLLRRLKATYNPTTDSYSIDEEQLSKLLEEEFNKRGLPLNVINSIQLKDGKFKYPFDATIARNSIEDVLLSLIDNQLRKQEVHGEALIQVSNPGFEEISTDESLPFYEAGKNNGKTSAQKVKIALQGNFELLLQHPDVLTLSSKDKITPLQALNTLIKDEKWLNKSNHRELISLGSVRIPVQGLNSMEFLEVYEFLPKEAGNIVVVSPALVAKAGSDFDWDKLTTLFPNIFYNSFTKELKLYNVKDIKLTNEEALKELKKQKSYPKEKINSLYKIRNELKEELETYKQERDLAKESKIDFLRHLRFLDIEIALFRQQLDLLEEAEFAFKNEDDLKVISDLVESTLGEIGVLQGIESAIEATKNKIKERVNQSNIEREFLVKSLNESINSSRENIAYSRKEIENIDKTINSVKSYLSDIQELIYKASAEKAYQNSLIKIMREVLEDPNNFVNLMLPNDTYMFEPNADKRRAAKNEGKKAGYSLVPSVVENLNQHEANFVGKDALGIAALYNKILPQLQKVGMYLNNTYISNVIFGTTRNTTNRFKHNEVLINNTPHISISGIYSVPNSKGFKFKISEAISQIMNGTVDVAKKPWIFDLNIKKEFIATQLFHLLQGTHKDDVMAFFNQPALDIYLKNLQNYKNPLLKAINPAKAKNAKAYAILSVIENYGNTLSEIRVDLGTIKKPNVKSIPEIVEILKEHLDNNKPQQFYGVVNKFRDLADAHPSLFNQKHYNFYKFAFPEENGKIAKPTTEEDKLAQVLYLIQYLELDEQNSKFQNVMKTTNQDTKKMGSVQLSLKRLTDLYQTRYTDLLPSDLVDKMINEGYTKGFTHEESGIDSFISQISKQLFELTNHKIINSFILDEFRKPFDDTTLPDKTIIPGNYIPFEKRTDDDFDSFTETIKNDFILYIYDNIVYEDGSPIISKVRKQMTYDSALATELEQIKINFPTLVKNNLFLSSLVRDNGNITKGNTKPTRVNIKSLISKPSKDVSDILTNDFNNLLNFSDETYPSEKQQVIQNFAKKLAKFAFVQSGLNNSPISFSKLIPQESYGEDITEAIKAMKDIFDNNPKEAQTIFRRFYFTYFRPNNSKFYQNRTIVNEDTGEISKAIPEKKDTFRLKDYQDPEFPDILKKKEKALADKILNSTSIREFTAGEAFSNPTTLYIYEQNYENKYAKGSANILIDKNTIKKAENTVPIYLYPSPNSKYTDKDLPIVSKNIDNAIREIVQKFSTGNYKEIVFPTNLTDISNLKESSPQAFNLLANTLKEQFGITLKNAKFEEIEPLQTSEFEQVIVSSQDMKNPKNYTNYSGAAEGGDKEWEKIGKEFGIGKQVNFVPNDIKRLTPEQLTEVENAYQKAVKDLGRRPLDANTYAGGLVRRDYLQAKAGDAIFAISTILEPNQTDKKGYKNKSGKKVVEGGTGYAVQMGINLGKIVYVFDQIKGKWFTWSLNMEGNPDFVETNTPILTEKFTGIGTRELNDLGKKAIRDVYEKTFNQQNQETKKGCDNPF